MRLQPMESNAPAEINVIEPEPVSQGPSKPLKNFEQHSTTLPFGQPVSLKSIGGPTYVTAQVLVQQVAYTLSDRLWTFSPITFDLDRAVKNWSDEGAENAHGYSTKVESMQIRRGAASIALGYIFSKDFDLRKRYIPQSILASTSTLQYLRDALDQLSLLYSVTSPLVAHVAAIDYAGATSRLVADYSSALSLAEELGFSLVTSFTAYEAQHMALFSTLLAQATPTMHIYDGISVGRETIRVIDTLDQVGLQKRSAAIQDEVSKVDNRSPNINAKVVRLLNAFNEELGTQYGLFEYQGHSSPDSVLVVFGTIESSLASQVALSLERDGAKVGVLNVRVYRPFVETEFLKALPESVSTVGVLGQVQDSPAAQDKTTRSRLYGDVLAALSFSDKWSVPPAVVDVKYPREVIWTPVSIAAAFQLLIKKPILQSGDDAISPTNTSPLQLLDATSVHQYTFWDIDTSSSINAPVAFGKALATDSAHNVSIKTKYNNLLQGGVVRTDVRKSPKSIEASYSIDTADVIYVGEQSLLEEIDVLNGLKFGGKILLRLPGIKDEDLESKLPPLIQKGLGLKSAQLYILDPPAIQIVAEDPSLEELLSEIAFLRAALPTQERTGLQKLASINGNLKTLEDLALTLDNALRLVEIPEAWIAAESEKTVPALPKDIAVNSFDAFDKIEIEPPTYLKDWKTAAKGLAFKEAYGTQTALRPDLSVHTYTVHVQENRRLTPLSYDRNIFHIEFDLDDSGLKYEIGEALGIHAENDEVEVNDFIKFYKLDPDEIF